MIPIPKASDIEKKQYSPRLVLVLLVFGKNNICCYFSSAYAIGFTSGRSCTRDWFLSGLSFFRYWFLVGSGSQLLLVFMSADIFC